MENHSDSPSTSSVTLRNWLSSRHGVFTYGATQERSERSRSPSFQMQQNGLRFCQKTSSLGDGENQSSSPRNRSRSRLAIEGRKVERSTFLLTDGQIDYLSTSPIQNTAFFGVALHSMNVIASENHCESPALPLRDVLLLIHYWLPVLLGWSVVRVIQHAEGTVCSQAGLTLLLAGIGAAYSLDRVIDTPEGTKMTPWLRGTLWGGVALCVGIIIFLVATNKIDHRVLGVIAILTTAGLVYSRLKRLPLLKTAVVAIAWTWACFALPFNGGVGHLPFFDVLLPLMLLIAAGCILCDLKDIEVDRRQQIPSLPAIFGIRTTCLIAMGMACLAAILALAHHRFGIASGALLLMVAAQFSSLLAMESLGPIMIDSILIVPGVLISTGIV